MPTRLETVLKRAAALVGVLSMAALGVGIVSASAPGWTGWAGLALLYATGVCYGLGEMVRLYHRHRRRCQTCLQGTAPHVRWWAPRVLLVLAVSVLPVLLLAPAITGAG